MKKLVLGLLTLPFFNNFLIAQTHRILESTSDHIKIEYHFENNYKVKEKIINGEKFYKIEGEEFYLRRPGEPWLPNYNLNIGIPFNANMVVRILNVTQEKIQNIFILPTPDSLGQPFNLLPYDQEIYSSNIYFPMSPIITEDFVVRYAHIANLSISPYQFNPVSRELLFNKKLIVQLDFKTDPNNYTAVNKIDDKMTEDLIRSSVINYEQAKNWISKRINEDALLKMDSGWYDPTKTYFKIYLKEKGVYRLSYDYLSGLNVPLQNVQINKLQIFSEEVEVPLFIKDVNANGIFENGDYLEFVGFPPPPSLYSGLNIYNLGNIVWFSFEADTSGLRYTSKDGYPITWQNTYSSSLHKIHYEIDTLYERLGHASNNQRDYWYWGKSSGNNGNLTNLFTGVFPSPENISFPLTTMKVVINMHGMTLSSCNPDHKVKISLTGQLIGEHTWDGPNTSTFETTVNLNQINLYPSNNFQVAAYGDYPICPSDTIPKDEIRVNWFEIEYLRVHRADMNHFSFITPLGATGLARLQIFNWFRDNMKIFVPKHNEMIVNSLITNDQYNSVLFVDDLYERTEYYCVAEDYFLLPDSVAKDKNASDLKNINNGADYIIITHPDFISVAERLANFRSTNFPDTNITSPRIRVVDIEDIYDEFSYGLLDPYAIQYFNKYAFDNWVLPSPSYVVLLGDMSYDYRGLLPESRPNFIPSIPYHSPIYGQAASDNLFVAVSGNDEIPDIAIGRLSCESVEEGNILVDKIINYPGDDTKKWRQRILLIGGGQSEIDEQAFGFNDQNLILDESYIIPNGLSSTKVFHYPTKPEHFPYQGGTPKIRQGFDDGAVLANYYGHGGGYQWDLVFTTDNIYELENGSRLPFISSVTCYTAHFDNQEVFGEQFNSVPNKGSIAFWGSSGLTWWSVGTQGNRILFDELINKKISIVGKFILSTKARLGTGFGQVNLLTLLGDPLLKLAIPDKPDFQILQSDISIEPKTPVTDQSVEIKVNIKNYGVTFPGDSVLIQLFASSSDTSYAIGEIKRGSFGEFDSIYINWNFDRIGLYRLTARINETEIIPEMDHGDNEASIVFTVFDLGEPSIVKPINGFISADSSVEFLFVDNGYYVSRNVTYLIEIDTSNTFTNSLIKSQFITPQMGLTHWQSPNLPEGKYFWRTRIVVEGDSTFWSEPRVLSVEYNSNKKGYNISGRSLTSLETNNIIYSDSIESLILNSNSLPPRPSNDTFEEYIEVQLPPDIVDLSSITTDGTYIYYAHMAWGNGISKIFKLGTGYNGTIKGQDYGSIPNIEVFIWHQMFYYPDNEGGHIYVATGDAYSLLKVDIETGDTSRVYIPDGILNDQDGLVHDGGFRISTDGRFVYNLAFRDSSGNYKYKIRTLDPLNNWNKVGNDIIPSGSSFENFRSFFIAHNFLFPYDVYIGGLFRRINLSNGKFEDEWKSYQPFQGFFDWIYDWVNDKVYASVSHPDFEPKFAVFGGTYHDANGSIKSHLVGPAAEWNSLEYIIDDFGSSGIYTTYVFGLNKSTKILDTLFVNPQAQLDISSIDANAYPFLQLKFALTDTSFGATQPIKIKSIGVDYDTPPELMVIRENIHFEPDTLLQGLDTEIKVKIINLGESDAKNIIVDYFFYPDGLVNDTTFIRDTTTITKNNFIEFSDTINTSPYIFDNIMKVVVSSPENELFSFNNISDNKVFVSRDSTNPAFTITFDGKEILDGDIVSSQPEVVITLKDNSPLFLTESLFTIVYDNEPLVFKPDTLVFDYTPYPNSEAKITWTPNITKDGSHTLEVLAKDASGNFFDSTSFRISFNVFIESDIRDVYNYPNPFGDNTHFTFQLRGVDVPDELKIKIYTIAGRMIREINVSPSLLNLDFNTIYWDGRDHDGDEIANGLYFYKVIYKNDEVVKTVTQKLAKVK